MFVGNVAALAQDNLKRLFAYSSISHAGFLMLGVAAIPTTGPNLNALYYYLVVYGLMFVGLFACLALIERQTRNTDIFQLSGMGFTHPVLSLCIAIFSVSAAGIPPTAGFFAKYFIFLDAVRAQSTLLVVLALIASLIGVYYYLRVVVYLYMKESKETLRLGLSHQKVAFACIIVCALSLLFFAVSPGSLALAESFAP
jgi:NADH-quinone oxidoreductase subunit N